MFYLCIVNKLINMFTAKLRIKMEVRIRKNRNITDTLRNLPIGESVVFKGATDSLRQIASRLAKEEGLRFTTSKKGFTNSIKIERIG